MRPSVRAEKYIRDPSGWRKDVTDGNDNGTDGQTDRRTDRVRRNMRPPPREESRIITQGTSICYASNFIHILNTVADSTTIATGQFAALLAKQQISLCPGILKDRIHKK